MFCRVDVGRLEIDSHAGDRALANKDIQQAVEDMSEAAGVDDDDVRGWVESIIGLCASALGIYVAHRLDDIVFLYGACGAGAALAVDKCAELGFSFKPRTRHLVVGACWCRICLSDDRNRSRSAILYPLAAAPVPRVGGLLVVVGLRHPRRRRAGGVRSLSPNRRGRCRGARLYSCVCCSFRVSIRC